MAAQSRAKIAKTMMATIIVNWAAPYILLKCFLGDSLRRQNVVRPPSGRRGNPRARFSVHWLIRQNQADGRGVPAN